MNRIQYLIKKAKSFSIDWPFWLGLFLVTLLLTHGYKFGYLYGVIDTSFRELGVQNAVSSYFFWWGDYRGAGELQATAFPKVIQLLYVYLLHHLFSDVQLIGFLKNFFLNLFVYIAGYASLRSFVRILKIQTSNWLIFFLSLFPFFNIYFLQSNQVLLTPSRYDFIAFCFLMYALNDLVLNNRWRLVILSTIFSIGSWDLFPYWIPFLLIVFAISIFYLYSHKIKFKKFLSFWLIYLTISLPAILSIAYYAFNLSLGESNSISYAAEVFRYANKNSTLANIFSFIGGVNWGANWNWNQESVFPFYDLFTRNGLFVVLRYIPAVIVFGVIFVRSKTRDALNQIILALVVLFIFFIGANNSPLGSLYTYGFEHNILFKLYRESHNKFYPALIYLLLLYILNNFNQVHASLRKFLVTLAVLYFGGFGFFFIRYSVYAAGNFFEVPKSYFRVADYINRDVESSVVAILPQLGNLHSYSYGHYGMSPLQNLLKVPTLLTYNALESKYNGYLYDYILDDFVQKKVDTTYSRGSDNPSFDTSRFDIGNVNYIILDGYLTGVPQYSRLEFNHLKGVIDNTKTFEMVLEEENLYVYKRKSPVQPLQNIVSYKKYSPVHYEVVVNLRGESEIKLLQSFHSGWNLCLEKEEIPLGDFSYFCFLKNEIVFRSHNLLDNYANSWMINQADIEAKFSSDFYRKNSDGSITLRLMIYFKPQIYLYLSFIPATLILIFLLTTKLYSIFRESFLPSTKV